MSEEHDVQIAFEEMIRKDHDIDVAAAVTVLAQRFRYELVTMWALHRLQEISATKNTIGKIK